MDLANEVGIFGQSEGFKCEGTQAVKEGSSLHYCLYVKTLEVAVF